MSFFISFVPQEGRKQVEKSKEYFLMVSFISTVKINTDRFVCCREQRFPKIFVNKASKTKNPTKLELCPSICTLFFVKRKKQKTSEGTELLLHSALLSNSYSFLGLGCDYARAMTWQVPPSRQCLCAAAGIPQRDSKPLCLRLQSQRPRP